MKRIAPFWAEALPAPAARVAVGTRRAEVAVVGAGLAGLSTALHVLRARPGARVLVLEAERVGAGASSRNTGMLGPGVGQSLLALGRRVGPERARALYQATLDAVADVAALIEREAIACELHLGGQLVLARSARSRARLARTHALLRELGLPGQALDDGALAARLRLGAMPQAGEGPAALLLPRAGTLHPGKLVAGLAARVRALGGEIVEGARVVRLGRAQPVRLELADGGEVLAEQAVLATAGYTSGLGVLRGRVLPLHLQALCTEPLSGEERARLGWAGREGALDARRVFSYFRLTADDRLIFGGGAPRLLWGERLEDAGGEAALAALATELERTLPEGVRPRIAGGWTGVIGYVLDALPAISRWAENPAVVHAVGWCGHGVALATAAGAWVARLLADGAAPSDLPWFRARVPLLPLGPVRWAGFQASVRGMALLDRLE